MVYICLMIGLLLPGAFSLIISSSLVVIITQLYRVGRQPRDLYVIFNELEGWHYPNGSHLCAFSGVIQFA